MWFRAPLDVLIYIMGQSKSQIYENRIYHHQEKGWDSEDISTVDHLVMMTGHGFDRK